MSEVLQGICSFPSCKSSFTTSIRINLTLRERVFLGKAWKMTERTITFAWAWFRVKNPHGFTSLVLFNHSWWPFSGYVGSLQVFGITLFSPASPCAMSLLMFSPKSRQHNCKHFYCTPESHIFPPHISFYCMAPVFCFHFLRISNKALTSFKGEELITLSSKFSGRIHRGNRGSLGGCSAFTPRRRGKNPYEVLSADVYSVFPTLRKVVSSFGWLLWSVPLVLGCWAAVHVSWYREEGSKELCLKRSQDPQSKNDSKNHCLIKSQIMVLALERNLLVMPVPITKH